jgi:hypothetical protein
MLLGARQCVCGGQPILQLWRVGAWQLPDVRWLLARPRCPAQCPRRSCVHASMLLLLPALSTQWCVGLAHTLLWVRAAGCQPPTPLPTPLPPACAGEWGAPTACMHRCTGWLCDCHRLPAPTIILIELHRPLDQCWLAAALTTPWWPGQRRPARPHPPCGTSAAHSCSVPMPPIPRADQAPAHPSLPLGPGQVLLPAKQAPRLRAGTHTHCPQPHSARSTKSLVRGTAAAVGACSVRDIHR